MTTTTFGLSYLDEQQRFRRTPKQPGVDVRPMIADFKKGTPATRPATTTNTLVRRVEPKPQPYLATDPIAQAEPEESKTIFAEQFSKDVKSRRKTLFKALPIAVAAVALVSGLAVLGLSLHQNHKAAAQVAAITQKVKVTSSAAQTAETPPDETPVSHSIIAKRTVAPDLPRTITIKKINVYARVLTMGVLPSGALETPRNTNDTGWYKASSKPGEGGAGLIVGHVSGAVNAGIFYNLKKLDVGDTITVERGDGVKIDYKVIKKEQVPSEQVDNAKLLLPVTVGKGGLNLMTCGGKYLSDKETFTDRVIIYTEQV